MKDHQSGQSRGFAFIELSTRREAQKAVSMFNKQNFMEKEILVNAARGAPVIPPEPVLAALPESSLLQSSCSLFSSRSAPALPTPDRMARRG
jgi:RNA recognition motif-containing protein